MNTYIRPAAMLLLLMTLLTGAVYPAVITLIAQSLFPYQANGSLIRDSNNQPIGSELISQYFSSPGYFWSRPSATGPYAYNAAASSGSNLGPTNPALTEAVANRIQMLKTAYPDNQAPIPIDLVTTSASGLDPHISIAAAHYQLKRVAKARKISETQLQGFLQTHIEDRQWGIFGEPRINVLKLNIALDKLAQ